MSVTQDRRPLDPADMSVDELVAEIEQHLEDHARDWSVQSRPEQLAPPLTASQQWDIWLLLAGRGFGKTRSMMEDAATFGRTYPGARIALVGMTATDARDVLVEGESGLLSCLRPEELRGGAVERAWNRGYGELYLANGTKFKCFSSETPRKLRGPQHHAAYADEIAQWEDAKKGARQDSTWSNLVIGVRLPRRKGWPLTYKPRIVAATTPRPVALLRSRDPMNPGLLEQKHVAVTTGRSVENMANLDPTYIRQVIEPLQGTKLGRQELDAVLMEGVEGALFKLDQIERDRIPYGHLPAAHETVVAVDPSIKGESNDKKKVRTDECGIVAVSSDGLGNAYVLQDDSLRGHPTVWAEQVWRTALEVDATVIVAEDNQGGEMVGITLMAAWPKVALEYEAAGKIRPSIELIPASQSKWARAVPVSQLYERHLIHHVMGLGANLNSLVLLEAQMTEWDGTGDSPDRLDALVHAIRRLYGIGNKRKQQVVARRSPTARR